MKQASQETVSPTILVVLVLVLLAAISCTYIAARIGLQPTVTVTDRYPGWATYAQPNTNVSLRYPNSWKITGNGSYVTVEPKGGTSPVSSAAGVTVFYYPAISDYEKSATTLKGLVDYEAAKIDGGIISVKSTTFHGLNAYSGVYPGETGNYALFLTHKGHLYVIVVSTTTTLEDASSDQRSVLDSINLD